MWLAYFENVRGREQAGTRPYAIVSTDRFNASGKGLVVAVPLTRTDRGDPWHVPVAPPEGGLRARSMVMCEQVRVLDAERLLDYWGALSPDKMHEIDVRLRRLLGL